MSKVLFVLGLVVALAVSDDAGAPVAKTSSGTSGGRGVEATLTVAGSEGSPGSTGVVVPVDLDNSMVVAGVQFTLDFDSSAVEVDTITATARTDSIDIFSWREYDSGKVVIIIAIGLNGKMIAPGVGAIANFLFDVKVGAPAGEYPLTVPHIVLSDPYGQPISTTVVEGVFRVLEQCELLGDVNCNGQVSIEDALCAFKRYIYQTFDSCEVVCDCSAWAADANCNGTITPGDALCIAWYALLGGIWPQDCGCPSPGKAASRERSPVTVRAASVSCVVGQRVEVPIIVEGQRELNAFGLRMGYPSEMLEFAGVFRTPVTQKWLALDGAVTQEGVLTLGGFHTEPLMVSGPVVVAEISFAIKEGTLDQGRLTIMETIDDLGGAKIGEGSVMVRVVPVSYRLDQNRPNPFNPSTTIRYAIPSREQRARSEGMGVGSALYALRTTLKVYNLLGQEVRTLVDEAKQPGYYTVTWDGRDSDGRLAASGIYFYRLEAGDFGVTKKMVLMR
ncbi:MAG: cohesin domain-containing protein [bacterium]